MGPANQNIVAAAGIKCSANILKAWNPQTSGTAVNYGDKTITKTPYSPLNLIYQQGSPAPNYHYPEVVSALLSHAVSSPIYVQDASPYLALLVGAASQAETKVILAHDFSQRRIT